MWKRWVHSTVVGRRSLANLTPLPIPQVWKREHKAEEEERRLAELQKQLQEERKKSELVLLAEAAGHLRCLNAMSMQYSCSVHEHQ